jgi:hypothetical protein
MSFVSDAGGLTRSGAVVALLAALTLSTGCTSSSHASTPPATPSVSPSAGQPSPLPAGRPAFFYAASTSSPLQPVGWDGTRYAPVELGTIAGIQAIQSPDGSRFLVGNAVYDRTTGGTALLPFDFNKGAQAMWADDSVHVCTLTVIGDSQSGNGTTSELDLMQPGGPTRVVARVGHDHFQAFALLRVCSVANDLVVVAQRAVMPISDVWVIRLSTGTVVGHRSYPQGGSPGTVVASPDGRLVAAVGSTSSDILTTGSFSRLAQVEGHVIAFSGDGNLVAEDDRVVAWRTGATTWRVPAGFTAVFVLAEPSGAALAIDLQAAATPEPPAVAVPDQLWLVTASAATDVADGIVPAFVTVN